MNKHMDNQMDSDVNIVFHNQGNNYINYRSELYVVRQKLFNGIHM